MIRAVPICVEADQITSTLCKERREPTQAEAEKIADAESLRDILIQVDAFQDLTNKEAEDGYTRPALVGTPDRMEALNFKLLKISIRGRRAAHA